MKHHIRICIDIINKNQYKCEAVGISNLTNKTKILAADIHNATGEFVGYYLHKGQLSIFRDRLGARNIYYDCDSVIGKVYVSTDLVWLVTKLKPDLNNGYVEDEYNNFQVSLSDRTPYHNIFRVMPGTIDHFRVGPEMFVYRDCTKYWKPKYSEKEFNPRVLRELLNEAVTFRKNIIGKYTSYLSGGLDSSSITALAKPKEAFSGYYREEGYSEMDYINRVVESVPGLKSVPVQITPKAFHRLLPYLGIISPDPQGGLGIIPQVIVAQQAFQKGYRYSFTGEGGDEVFTGYAWNTIIFSLNNAIPNLLRDRYLIRYEQSVNLIREQGWLGIVASFLSRNGNLTAAVERFLPYWDDSQPVENNVLNINLKVGLPAILTVDEAVGHYTGVMPVSPMVDHNVVDYVCSIRPEERSKIPKYMLREAVSGLLPERVRTRYDKMGFPVPYQKWKWPMLKKALVRVSKDFPELVNSDINQVMHRRNWAAYNIYSIIKLLEDRK